MSGLDDVKGHERPIRVLKRALENGRTPHAYLFWGPEGVGKELVAFAVSKILLCASPDAIKNARPCGVCPSCAKCEAHDHPDLHLLAPGAKAISVDEVRGLGKAIAFQAYENGRKVVIIRDSFSMSREAANALLKTVEEPPPDTFMFLLANHREQLLETIVSRCQGLRFDPLDISSVEEVLADNDVDPEAIHRLAVMSGGSPGVALTLEPGQMEEVDRETVRIRDELENMDRLARFELAERWSKDKGNLKIRLDSLERGFALKAHGDPFSLQMVERIGRVREWIERNANVQLALDGLFVAGDSPAWEEIN